MAYLKLIKYLLTLTVAFSGVAGYLLFNKEWDFTLWQFFAGLYLMAGGASALNQWQERHRDIHMTRTRKRPIPSGQISPNRALAIAWGCIAVGGILLAAHQPVTALLGLTNVLVYNYIYTPSKTKSPFSIFPGSLVGALPPLMGWTMAGGSLSDAHIYFLAGFIFLWQIPHFWLLLIKYGEDYEQAGFASLMRTFELKQIKILVVIWAGITSAFLMLFPLFGIVLPASSAYALLAVNLLFIALFTFLLFGKSPRSVRMPFMVINFYMIGALLIICFI